MNKKSSYKIITTGFIGAVLATAMILSVVATVAEPAEAKPKTICYLVGGVVNCHPTHTPSGEPVAPIVLP